MFWFLIQTSLIFTCFADELQQYPHVESPKYSVIDLRCLQPMAIRSMPVSCGQRMIYRNKNVFYSFNLRTGRCERRGNFDCPKLANRFDTKDDCEQTCLNPETVTRWQLRKRYIELSAEDLCDGSAFMAVRANTTLSACGNCKKQVYKYDSNTQTCFAMTACCGSLVYNAFPSYSGCLASCSNQQLPIDTSDSRSTKTSNNFDTLGDVSF